MRIIKSAILLFLIHKAEKYARNGVLWGRQLDLTNYYASAQNTGNKNIVGKVNFIQNDKSRIYNLSLVDDLLFFRDEVDRIGINRDAEHQKLFKISRKSNLYMQWLLKAYKKFYPKEYKNILSVDFSKLPVNAMLEHEEEKECYRVFIESVRRVL